MTAFIRPKIIPRIEHDTGAIVLLIEWIVTNENSEIGLDPVTGEKLVQHREEVRIMPARFSIGYVCEVGTEHAHAGLPAFFIDPAGLRHFVTRAEAAEILPFGAELSLKKE